MLNIKQVIKKIVGYRNINYMRFVRNTYRKEKKYYNNSSALNVLLKAKLISDYEKLFKSIELTNEYKTFYYSIDRFKTYFYNGDVVANLMLDYNKVINNSLNNYINQLTNSDFAYKAKKCINGINLLLDREIEVVKEDKEIVESLKGIKNRKANSLKDAIQRILFFNQLMWQTGHILNGLGRLDYLLINYYEEDIKNNIITKEEAKELLKEFLTILHKDYYFKSNSLSGDTGQIIILGGIDENGNNVINELTYLFIELMIELQLPDPKVLLRVNKNTPKKLIELSIKCIKTGIGCPLFANDDVIIPKLISFGFDKEDAYNYGTAACWEPFITGKSFDQNNLKSISFMEPLKRITEQDEFAKLDNIEDLVKIYNEKMHIYLNEFIKEIDKRRFGEDILLSIFTDNCIKENKDISNSGAKYNNYGFTGVGLPNAVNSILMINKYVFKEKEYTLEQFNEIRKNNFKGYEELLKKIKENKEKYGTDNEFVIKLTNEIIKNVTKFFDGKTNPKGGKYKFGLSAPSYIDESRNFPASFDGRKNSEPFAVHISSDTSNAYTELFQFASKLDYGNNRFNGNVIDFIVSPSFIEDNFEKFVDFMILSVKLGFFEMQMNVVSSKILIEARKNPDKFPNLIVRVWGFSSYFNDLPDEYKDYLIERALKSEGNSY